MKTIFILGLLAFALTPAVLAHDEGHGPKLADSGKYGGLVAAVIDRKEAKLGAKALVVYKAELVRSSGKVRLYLYDTAMKPLESAKFSPTVKVVMAFEDPKTKKPTDRNFDLAVDGKSFSGQIPVVAAKTYNLDFVVKEGDRELLTAFDNLD